MSGKQRVVTRKGINYWRDYEDAVLARDGVRDRYPDARVVQYEVGFAVQLCRSGPYLPEDDSSESECEKWGGRVNKAYKRNVPTRDIGDKVHNWWSADTFLGRRNQRKLANNTVVYRDPIEPDAIRVKLHYTVIVTYFRDGRIQINSGGHHTKTTKQRLNQLLPHGVGIHQKNFDWYVSAGDSTVSFRDGMILTPFGEQWTPAGQRYAINPHRRNPGKFNNELDEAVWSAMMDQSWVNEQESADGLGWIGVSYGMTLQELAEQGHGDLEELAFVARRNRIPMQRDGTFFAVAYEGDSGFVYVSYHESEQGALDFFYRDVAATFGDDPDEYDELDEPEHEDLT